ncbi:unnamed protein product [Ilex paraguariensis]|uniref:Uncharacterized protein n=1 Tax=Ilex paraguariensis TaxID=185542 RepID=A0ABC8TZB0_9AQUA
MESLVYYLLRKTKGFSIEGHLVVQSLVEIRLFLEKIRPIDKKLQYQIQKLTRVTGSAADKGGLSDKEGDATQKMKRTLQNNFNPLGPKGAKAIYKLCCRFCIFLVATLYYIIHQ